MSFEEKNKSVEIVNKYGAIPYASVECIEDIRNIFKITLRPMQDLHVCIILSIDNTKINCMFGPPLDQTAVDKYKKSRTNVLLPLHLLRPILMPVFIHPN